MARSAARRRTLRGFAVLFAASSLMVGAAVADARLTFKRDDGSVIPFRGTPRAWCGPWEADVARPSVHVALRNPRRVWQLSAVRRNVKDGQRIEFPNSFNWDKPHGAQLFVGGIRNEASTAEEESSGSMAFSRVSCRRGGVVAFRIDAVLGSEFFDGALVHVSGTYRGRVSEAP